MSRRVAAATVLTAIAHPGTVVWWRDIGTFFARLAWRA
ncbi:hypothetical protein M2317_002049 [Microbacterium sp. ZKA21]